MEALQLAARRRLHPYACQSIEVRPYPPQVGVPATLALALTNPGPDPVTVRQVTFQIAKFGMGMTWEKLPPLGPFEVPADPAYCEMVEQSWTPTVGGHRCAQAVIQLEGAATPIYARRNLEVIRSEAERSAWEVHFGLGNPEEARLPIALRVGGGDAQMMAGLMIGGRMVPPGEEIWLDGHQEVEGVLLLRALTAGRIASVHTIEAFLGGRFLDGIQVEVQRAPSRQFLLDEDDPTLMGVEQEAFARAR